MTKRLTRLARVRLRLLSDRDRDRVIGIAHEWGLPVATVLDLLATRFRGSLDDYEAHLLDIRENGEWLV